MKFSEDTRTLETQRREREQQEKSDSDLVVALRHVSVQWVRFVSDRYFLRRPGYAELITATKVPQSRFK
jgi:hypothetical protein